MSFIPLDYYFGMNIGKACFFMKEYLLFVLSFGHSYLKKHHVIMPSMKESLDLVTKHMKDPSYRGFIRFGDGEYGLIKGRSIQFQRKNKELSKKLRAALENVVNLNIDIGINVPNYLHSGKLKVELKLPWPYFYTKTVVERYKDRNQNFLYSGFTMPYLHFILRNDGQGLLINYLEQFRRLFAGRDVALFIGEGICQKVDFFPFEYAKSFDVIECPSENAFEKFDDICDRARNYAKDTILCFVIGPTSKVLAYQLMSEGYLCMDLGHFIKDYDMYRKGVTTQKGFFDKDV